jgi:hypothetical protein
MNTIKIQTRALMLVKISKQEAMHMNLFEKANDSQMVFLTTLTE